MKHADLFRRALVATGSVVASGLMSSAALAAPTSSMAESRGYQKCSQVVSKQVRLLALEPDYYIFERDDSRSLYLHGTARVNGVSTPIRIACDTNRSGSRLLTVNIEEGRYLGRLVDPAAFASQ